MEQQRTNQAAPAMVNNGAIPVTAKPVRQLVIVGGGTAGWMAALFLSRLQVATPLQITLIESSKLGTVGVGEATIPSIVHFNHRLGLDELDFIKATQASFKLGIEFENWSQAGQRFFHPFADFGMQLDGVPFHHYLNRLALSGETHNFEDYSFACLLARQHKFAQPPERPQTPLADYSYAYHFDAGLYAQYLKQRAIAAGIRHIDAEVCHVALAAENGFIEHVVLDNGAILAGDFFIDCSGFRSLLLGQALGVGYHSWHHWLLCDGAFAVQTTRSGPLAPYTRSIAMEAGWQWRIPLQHRMGNGHIFASAFCSDAAARQTLLDTVDGQLLTEPRKISFTPGRRDVIWHKNCFALGLASGFLEPLESTSISLIQTALAKLEAFFPHSGIAQCDITEVNRLHQLELEQIRDFLILHYKLTQRDDTEFWRYCANMAIPDTLAHKIELYRHRGHVALYEQESFKHSSWLAMYNGFQLRPVHCDPRANRVPMSVLKQTLGQMQQSMAQAVAPVTSHQEFIRRHCQVAAPQDGC